MEPKFCFKFFPDLPTIKQGNFWLARKQSILFILLNKLFSHGEGEFSKYIVHFIISNWHGTYWKTNTQKFFFHGSTPDLLLPPPQVLGGPYFASFFFVQKELTFFFSCPLKGLRGGGGGQRQSFSGTFI